MTPYSNTVAQMDHAPTLTALREYGDCVADLVAKGSITPEQKAMLGGCYLFNAGRLRQSAEQEMATIIAASNDAEVTAVWDNNQALLRLMDADAQMRIHALIKDRLPKNRWGQAA